MGINIHKSILVVGLSSFWIYLLPSGGLQPGFAVFLVGAAMAFSSQAALSATPSVLIAIATLGYCCAINGYYAITLQHADFLAPIYQHVFAVLLIVFVSKTLPRAEPVTAFIGAYAAISLIANTLLWALGFGRYDFEPRYNGFLNDPNQFAFFVLCFSFMAISMSTSLYLRVLSFFSAAVLLLASQSRSGFLGAALGCLWLVTTGSPRKRAFLLAAVITTGLLIALLASSPELSDESSVLARIVIMDLNFEFWQRGFYRVVEFPQEVFFGAGKGDDARFGYAGLEIHSTPIAIAFYYGVVAFILFYCLYAYVFLTSSLSGQAFLVAMFGYSLTTYAFRTPLFWFSFFLVATAMRRNRTTSSTRMLTPQKVRAQLVNARTRRHALNPSDQTSPNVASPPPSISGS